MAEYESVYDPKVKRDEPTKAKKPPGFICETAFASISLFMLKFYSDAAFDALTFTTVLLPVMAYFVLSIMFNILKFLKLLHLEDVDDEDAGLLTPKQMKLLVTVTRNLLGYFGTYMIAGELDKHIVQKQLATINMMPACVAI